MIDATTLDTKPSPWIAAVERYRAENRDLMLRCAREADGFLAAVEAVSGTCISDICGGSKHRAVVLARRAFIHGARKWTTASMPQVARILGRSHSACCHLHRTTDQQARDIAERAAQLMGWTTK